jgi:tryptophan synthase alpha chain
MGRIDDIFAQLRPLGLKALMPFVCGGHPRPGQLGAILKACEQGGAVIAEVGIPFSDPIADGPVIAGAMDEALRAGATPKSVFEEIAAARGSLGLGLVAMVSVSIVQRMGGPTQFVTMAKQAGVDGLIVPDVPLEESQEIRDATRGSGLSFSMLIAPTTPVDRAQAIARASTGFVYLLARTGITGVTGGPAQSGVPQIAERVKVLREVTDLPIACGFGLSTPEQVAAVVAHADAAIVGSALVKKISEAAKAHRDPGLAAKQFVESLSIGLAGSRVEL